MFGCVGRIVVVAVLVVVGVVAWFTRGAWDPIVRAKLGLRPVVAAPAPAWEPVTAAGAGRVRAAIAGMQRHGGPAYLNVKAGDLVAFVLDSMLHTWSSATPGAAGAEAMAGENTVSIRGSLHMKDLGGAAALGPLAGMLEGDQPIELRGRLEVTADGRGLFRVERIALKDLVLPSAAIGPIVRRLAAGGGAPADLDAIALVLPAGIADIRVSRGRVTLYRAVQ